MEQKKSYRYSIANKLWMETKINLDEGFDINFKIILLNLINEKKLYSSNWRSRFCWLKLN